MVSINRYTIWPYECSQEMLHAFKQYHIPTVFGQPNLFKIAYIDLFPDPVLLL